MGYLVLLLAGMVLETQLGLEKVIVDYVKSKF